MRHLLAILCLALVGCPKQDDAKPASPMGAGEQLSGATVAANSATASADGAEAERLAKLRANVDAAASAPNIGAAPASAGCAPTRRSRARSIAHRSRSRERPTPA